MSFWTPVENPGTRPLRSWVFDVGCALLAAASSFGSFLRPGGASRAHPWRSAWSSRSWRVSSSRSSKCPGPSGWTSSRPGRNPGDSSPGCGRVPACPAATTDVFLKPDTLTDPDRLAGIQLIAMITGLELWRAAIEGHFTGRILLINFRNKCMSSSYVMESNRRPSPCRVPLDDSGGPGRAPDQVIRRHRLAETSPDQRRQAWFCPSNCPSGSALVRPDHPPLVARRHCHPVPWRSGRPAGRCTSGPVVGRAGENAQST